MEIQKALGSDIVMAFDQCLALPEERGPIIKSMHLTLDWAKRCRNYHLATNQYLFGIVQGGLEVDLRLECLEQLKGMGFAGFALGGLSVGEKNWDMVGLVEEVAKEMPPDRPRYLMGVGTPLDILRGVRAGIDMFDCVLPTRNARNGQLFTRPRPFAGSNENSSKGTMLPQLLGVSVSSVPITLGPTCAI